MKIPRRVACGIRKIVGDCYNSVVDQQIVSWSPDITRTQTQPNLFGIVSNWFLDKRDKIDFMNSFLTAAQITSNTHLYPQNCSQKFEFYNPCSYPIRMELFKCTIKCNKGQSSGPYVFPLSGTQAGPDLTTDVEFKNTVWDQSMRDQTNAAAVPAATYQVIAVNTLGVGATIPLAGQNLNPWEEVHSAYPYRDQSQSAMRMKLSWIFPKMRANLKVQRVFKGIIPGRRRRTAAVKEHWPHDIKPLDLLDQFVPTLQKDTSFFYFIRATAVVNTMGAANPQAAFGAAGTSNTYLRYLPVQIIVKFTRNWATRNSGDHVPNYMCGNNHAVHLLNPGSGAVAYHTGAAFAGDANFPKTDNFVNATWGDNAAP